MNSCFGMACKLIAKFSFLSRKDSENIVTDGDNNEMKKKEFIELQEMTDSRIKWIVKLLGFSTRIICPELCGISKINNQTHDDRHYRRK